MKSIDEEKRHGPVNVCPGCNAFLNDCTNLTRPRQEPRDGDISICAYCQMVSVFDGARLTLRLMTEVERRELPDDLTRKIAQARKGLVVLGLEKKNGWKRN